MNGKPDENDKKNWFKCLEDRMTLYDEDRVEAELVCWEESSFWFDRAFGIWRQGRRGDDEDIATGTSTTMAALGLDEDDVIVESIIRARNGTNDE